MVGLYVKVTAIVVSMASVQFKVTKLEMSILGRYWVDEKRDRGSCSLLASDYVLMRDGT